MIAMRKLGLLVFLLAAPFLQSCSSASGAPPLSIPAPAPARIRVSSSDEAGLVAVTGSAGAVTGGNTVRVTNLTASGQTPLQLAATRAETTAASDGSFSLSIAAGNGDSLSIVSIDPATGEESNAFEISVPAHAPHLTFSPTAITVDNNGRGYAVGTSGGNGVVSVVDLASNLVVSTSNLATGNPQAIVFDPGNNDFLIADPTNNVVLFVDRTDPSIQTSVAVTGAQSVGVDAATNQAVVGTTSPIESLVVIDLTSKTIVGAVPITNVDNPSAIYQGSPSVDAGGANAVIVSYFDDGSSQITAKGLSALGVTHSEVIPNSSLQGVALFGTNQALAVDAQGNRVFFADLSGATAAVPLSVGNNPQKAAVDAATDRAYVTNLDDHNVSVINLISPGVTGTLDAGINPRGIAFDSSLSAAVTANIGDNSLTVLQ